MLKVLIVGGDWSNNPRKSSIVTQIGEYFNDCDMCNVYNGGTYEELKVVASVVPNYNLVMWMPNIPNEYEDIQIYKSVGAVLFVSKVIRSNRTRLDAVSRIFKYNGNAVISITGNNPFNFELIDALDNTWCNTSSLEKLTESIKQLAEWTRGSVRRGTKKSKNPIEQLIDINKLVADESEKQNFRYFGNLSTRCTKMFPSIRTTGESYLVSARNTDKSRLSKDDMVQTTIVNNKIVHFGERKPSVDTPVQIELYKNLPNINFFIHGHTFVDGAPETEHYYPCGDLREVPEILKLIKNGVGVINLKNHGFLMYSDTIENLESIANKLKFRVKEINAK